MVYLDNAATTPVCPAAAEAVGDVLTRHFGNASALYDLGLDAGKILDHARGVLAGALGARPGELYFTASGTEANNLAILGAARARRAWGREIVVTGFEHPSAERAAQALAREGFTVQPVAPDRGGNLDVGAMVDLVGPQTALVICMAVNNETGAMPDIAALAAGVKEKNRRCAVHCDFVQGFLKHPLALENIDTVAVSGHKVHAPKGVGALYVRRGLHIEPVIHGGGQERGLRSGTENVAYAAGFAAAVEAAAIASKALAHVRALNQQLRERLSEPGGAVMHSPVDASPYILSFSLPGFRSETLLHFLEAKGIYVSSGSACARGAPSHTLTAMGLDGVLVDSALRVSFCPVNTSADVDALAQGLQEAQKTLVSSGGRRT